MTDTSAQDPADTQPLEPTDPQGAQAALDPADAPATSEPGDDTAASTEPDKGSGVQKRIDELTASRRAAERRAREAQEQNAKLLALLERQAQPQQQTQAPQPAKAPVPDDFENTNEFLAAHAAHVAREAAAKAVAEERKKAAAKDATDKQNSLAVAHQERCAKAAEKYADFDEVAYSEEAILTDTMAYAMFESENGPDIQYYLGKNPAESKRIAQLSAFQQAVEMGKLESRLAAGAKPPPRKQSDAPNPPTALGGTAGPEKPIADVKSQREYEQRRLREMGFIR